VSRLSISAHALEQAARRGVDEETIQRIATEPEQVIPVRIGREVRQSRVTFPPEGHTYLVRVFVDIGVGAETVVTVYRTSKIAKYWRTS